MAGYAYDYIPNKRCIPRSIGYQDESNWVKEKVLDDERNEMLLRNILYRTHATPYIDNNIYKYGLLNSFGDNADNANIRYIKNTQKTPYRMLSRRANMEYIGRNNADYNL